MSESEGETPSKDMLYSRVPNKRGGGGLGIAGLNNNRRGWNSRGGGIFREIENSTFLVIHVSLYIYVSSDVTDMYTYELWFC